MLRRRTLLTAALACALGSSCREPRAFDDPAWRPAAAPQRVVAGSVLSAEVLLALDIGERLCAVHELAADPGYSAVHDLAAALPLVGAGPEQLLSVQPDLVVVDAYTSAETVALLGAADVPVVRTGDAQSFAGVAANLRRLGRIVHAEAAAERLTAALDERLAALAAAGAGLPPFRLLTLDGALHTHGAGSLFDAIVRAAGARNVAADEGVGAFRALDLEEVLAWRPDALVLALPPGDAAVAPAWLLQMPGMQLLPCVRRERIVFVPAALLASTSHHAVEAAAVVQRQLRAWGSP